MFKIHDLTEQFSPNKTWFVRTMNKLFELGGELVTAEMSDKFIKSISEWESEIDGEKFRESTIKIYLNVLKKNPNISDSMMKVIAWILGEYGCQSVDRLDDIVQYLCESIHRTFEKEQTRSWILTALTKIQTQNGFSDEQIDGVFENLQCSRNEDVHQRCVEYWALKKNSHSLEAGKVLMGTVVEAEDMHFDFSLSFMDNFVQESVVRGAKTYDESRKSSVIEKTGTYTTESELNFRPYERPTRGTVMKVTKENPYSNPLFEKEEQ